MNTTRTGPTRDRLATAALRGVAVAGWVAVPDYVHTPRARRLARAGVAAATVAAGLLVVRPWESGAAAPPPAPMHDAETATRDAEAPTTPSPDPDAFTRLLDEKVPPRWRAAAGVGAVAAVLGVAFGINRASDAVVERLAAALARRGVPRPNTLLGLAVGAASAALQYAEDGERPATGR